MAADESEGAGSVSGKRGPCRRLTDRARLPQVDTAVKPENVIQSEILRVIGSRPDVRLFRNQVGRAKTAADKWVSFGLAKGSADLIGIWTPMGEQAKHYGERGLFLSIECKSDSGSLRPEQVAWQRMVIARKGINIIARSVADVEHVLGAAPDDSPRP